MVTILSWLSNVDGCSTIVRALVVTLTLSLASKSIGRVPGSMNDVVYETVL